MHLISLPLLPVVLFSLWTTAECICRRSGGTNCATANGECSVIFHRNGDFSQLPWPRRNHRTCYRTCFEDNICKTQFQTTNRIRRIARSPQFAVRMISSPRYNGSGSNFYRPSTNCRFNLRCTEGHLLSYSVNDFKLEEKLNCSSGPECVDWVEHHMDNFQETRRMCGRRKAETIPSDGSSGMLVEFVSNRRSESVGFKYFVQCIAPAFDNNAVNSGLVPDATPEQLRIASQCTSPGSNRERRQTFNQLPPQLTGIASLPDVSHYIVGIADHITFGYFSINLHHGEHIVLTRPMYFFHYITPSSTTRYFAPQLQLNQTEFSGYGHLLIAGISTFFYQASVDPVFQPSPEEAVVIHKLEAALNTALGDYEYYDVIDDLDVTSRPPVTGVPGVIGPPNPPPPPVPGPPGSRPPGPPGSPPGSRPPGPPGSPPGSRPPGPPGVPQGTKGQRGSRAAPGIIGHKGAPPPTIGPTVSDPTDAEIALMYGNACNGVLRAMACAYQSAVLHRNCT